jgi:hypothetical protein
MRSIVMFVVAAVVLTVAFSLAGGVGAYELLVIALAATAIVIADRALSHRTRSAPLP